MNTIRPCCQEIITQERSHGVSSFTRTFLPIMHKKTLKHKRENNLLVSWCFEPSQPPGVTSGLVSGLCSMELSPALTPSSQLYVSLQICAKDATFPVPVAFSSWHCDRCMCVWGEGGEGERECECVCVDGFIVECHRRPLLYTLRLGLMIRLGAL